jgi:hypothetical protein
MLKRCLAPILITASIVAVSAILLFSWSFDQFWVPCWKEIENGSRIECSVSFYKCPDDLNSGYPPYPLQCP